MSLVQGIEFQRVAAAAVTGATGVLIGGRGILGNPNRTGAGVYDITLIGTGVAANECNAWAQVRGAASGDASVDHVSAVLKRVRCFNQAGAAADLDFDFVVDKFAQAQSTPVY